VCVCGPIIYVNMHDEQATDSWHNTPSTSKEVMKTK